jgi:hypothetical protein
VNADTMIADAVAAGMKQALQNVRAKLRDACLVQPTYEHPFGTAPGVDAKIEDIVQLLLPLIAEVERNKVYSRMAGVLRGGL